MKVKKIKKQVDQQTVLHNLGQHLNESTEASQALHWSIVSALVDAYDQEITREAFCNLVTTALNAKGTMSGAVTLRMMRARLAEGVLDDDLIGSSIVGNLEYANHFRADLAQQYALVTECRGEEDKVN